MASIYVYCVILYVLVIRTVNRRSCKNAVNMVGQLGGVEIMNQPVDRKYFEDTYGQVWDTSELIDEFEVIGFLAPFVSVRRRSDNVKGSMMFNHKPRYYHSFIEKG